MNKTELKIYGMLKQRATSKDQDGTFCIYPIKELANNGEVSEITVKRTLNELEINFYILRKRQGRGREQKIYLLKNDTSTNCEEPKNDTSTNCEEREKQIIDMVMSFATGRQETAKELATPSKYLYFLQNRLTNALGHTSQRSFNNMSPVENSITTHENVDIKVLSPANFFSSRWNVPTHKVYDLLMHKFSEILPRGKQITAEIIRNNRSVQISVQEFAEKCHIDMKEARQYLNEAISTLYELSIKFEVIEPENNAPKPKRRKKNSELQNKRYIYHRILSERSDDNCNNPVVNGVVTVKLDFDFAELMSRYSRAMPKHDNMFRINGNRHPHSYFMANKLHEHYFMNIGKNNSNRIKVRSLIQDLPDLPTYDEVMNTSGDRHIELRIIRHLLMTMISLKTGITAPKMVNFLQMNSYRTMIIPNG